MRRTIRLKESELRRMISESVKRVLKEAQAKTSLKTFMKMWYDNDNSCEEALAELTDDAWLRSMGWERVFHEGIGDGVYSPEEGVVAVFDCDDLPEYHEYELYKYNPKAWKSINNGGWDNIYNGDNGGGFDVERF